MNLQAWQRSNILGAINYLKDVGRGNDSRAALLVQGLLEVLEPARRTVRLQREAAQAAVAAGSAGRERRFGRDRRGPERRRQNPTFDGPDRRLGKDRRVGEDRRNR
jgi:hypothetical protein